MDTKEILEALCTARGNSGAEDEAAAVGERLLAPYGRAFRDNLGNVICEIAPKKNGRHVLLDAHIDQIALIVTHVDENGFVFAMNCGGIDRRSIWGTRVTVMGRDGEYPGAEARREGPVMTLRGVGWRAGGRSILEGVDLTIFRGERLRV